MGYKTAPKQPEASYSRAPQPSPPAAAPTPSSSSSTSWRTEGISSGRRSSSRRSSRRSRASASNGSFSLSTNEPFRQQRSESVHENSYHARRSSSGTPSNNRPDQQSNEPELFVPPHRRTQPSIDSAARVKKRLRELKVDEDFDQMKKDMGL